MSLTSTTDTLDLWKRSGQPATVLHHDDFATLCSYVRSESIEAKIIEGDRILFPDGRVAYSAFHVPREAKDHPELHPYAPLPHPIP